MRRASMVLLLAACGGTGGSGQEPGADAGSGGVADAQPEAADTMMLAEYSWTLPAHTESYWCVRRTVDRDLYIRRIEPIIPLGTHHTVLTRGDSSTPDGVTQCSSINFEPQMLFGSGVGTPPMDMPAGVVMKVGKGQQVLLNLHLFNVGDGPLSGRSGIRVTLADPAGQIEAEALLAGTIGLDIPPGLSTQSGTCTVRADATLFAIGPHMHRLGIHQKVTHLPGAQVLYDRDYSFDTQTFEVMSVPLKVGDQLQIDCSYANDTSATVHWGESTTAEMCFAGVFVYPAGRNPIICLN